MKVKGEVLAAQFNKETTVSPCEALSKAERAEIFLPSARLLRSRLFFCSGLTLNFRRDVRGCF